MRLKRILLFSFIISVVLALCLYFTTIFSFLSYNRSVNPDILLIEGWLPDESIDKACTEFFASHYRSVITTGFPHYKGYTIGSFGELRFLINEQRKPADTSLIISLTARGTKAFNVFPHFKLYADTVLIGESYTHSKIRDYTYACRLNFVPASIIIEFDNDAYSLFRDRNLIVYSVTVNDHYYDVNSANAAYYERSAGLDIPYDELNISTAHETAVNLCKRGIPDSLIIPVCSLLKTKSKTYTNGLDVYQWLLKNTEYQVNSITIFTSGSHARRSYMSYRKAIKDKSIEVGVISCYDPKVNTSNWWKSAKGIKEILYESIGCLYVFIFL